MFALHKHSSLASATCEKLFSLARLLQRFGSSCFWRIFLQRLVSPTARSVYSIL